MAESADIYVKIGQDGQYLERTVGPREIDRVNLVSLGFMLKGSKGAPKPSDGTVPPPADSNDVPTSVRAAAVAAAADSTGPAKTKS